MIEDSNINNIINVLFSPFKQLFKQLFKQDLYKNLYFSKIPRLFLESKISIIIFLKVCRINYKYKWQNFICYKSIIIINNIIINNNMRIIIMKFKICTKIRYSIKNSKFYKV